MAVIPLDFGLAVCHFTGDNLPHGGAVTFGFGNGDENTANSCAQRVYNAVAPIVDNLSSADVSFATVDVKLGPNETGNIGTYTGATVVGAVGGTSLSPGTSLLFHKQTAVGGRRGRGRMYWPGVYEGWVDDKGLLVSGVPATINTQMTALLNGLVTELVPMFLLHTPSYTWEIIGGQPRRVYADPGSVPIPYQVTSMTSDLMCATQRRRLR